MLRLLHLITEPSTILTHGLNTHWPLILFCWEWDRAWKHIHFPDISKSLHGKPEPGEGSVTLWFMIKIHIFAFFGHAHGIHKFPGQELNPCHRGNPSSCSVSDIVTSSLTHCATRETYKRSLKLGKNSHKYKVTRWFPGMFTSLCCTGFYCRNVNIYTWTFAKLKKISGPPILSKFSKIGHLISQTHSPTPLVTTNP